MIEEEKYYSFVRKVFDVLAPFYNVVVVPFSGVRTSVIDFVNAQRSSRILDVATGTGKQALAFAKRGYDVTGVDFSEGMIRVAKRKSKYKNAKFQVVDAARLPFENNSFDIVSVCFALHTMPPTIRQKVLNEIVRVTKRRGTVVICDFAVPLNRAGKYLVYELFKVPMGKYFVEFTHSDLKGQFKALGMDAVEERRAVLTAVRIIKGTIANGSAN